MLYTKICNAIWMYLWVGALLLAVIVQCLIFMKKAWKHALELGLQPAQIKKGLTTGITISIMPTLPVLLVLISLMPLLVAAAWVMTVGGSACVLWSSLAIKPISMLYEKAEKIDMKLVLSIGAGCLAGVMAYVSVSYGFSAMSTKGVVFGISFAVGALMVWIHNKRPKAKWLSDYLMTISMVIAMIAACIIF